MEEAFEKACEFIEENKNFSDEVFFEDSRNAFVSETDDNISRFW